MKVGFSSIISILKPYSTECSDEGAIKSKTTFILGYKRSRNTPLSLEVYVNVCASNRSEHDCVRICVLKVCLWHCSFGRGVKYYGVSKTNPFNC